MYKVQSAVECLIFYKRVYLSIVGTIFTGDVGQFGLLDININLGINWLLIHRATIDYKGCQFSLRGGKIMYMFLWAKHRQPLFPKICYEGK